MEGLRPIITGLLGGLLGGAIGTWLIAWAKREAACSRDDGVIRYGRRAKLLAILMSIGLLLLGTVALIALLDQPHIAYPLGGAMLLASSACVAEAFYSEYKVTDTHLETRSLWRTNRVIPWDDFIAYRFSELNQWHVLGTRNHGKVRLSVLLSGLDQLAAHLKHLRLRAVFPAARKTRRRNRKYKKRPDQG